MTDTSWPAVVLAGGQPGDMAFDSGEGVGRHDVHVPEPGALI